MHYRNLGRTGLKVSFLSLGTGGPSILGQDRGMSQKEQDALVRRCLDLGINLFDTSELYKRSENILGRALRGVRRDSYIMASKWVHKRGGGLIENPQELATSVENSLRRLGIDYIDIMQFHGVLPGQYHDVVERFYPTMKGLQQAGKIRLIGFTEVFSLDPTHGVVVWALKNQPYL